MKLPKATVAKIGAGTHSLPGGVAAVCSALRAGTQHYVGIPDFLLFNPNSNRLVRSAAAFYYLSEEPREEQAEEEKVEEGKIKRQ